MDCRFGIRDSETTPLYIQVVIFLFAVEESYRIIARLQYVNVVAVYDIHHARMANSTIQ